MPRSRPPPSESAGVGGYATRSLATLAKTAGNGDVTALRADTHDETRIKEMYMDDYIVCTRIDDTVYRCSDEVHCDYEDARQEANDLSTEFAVPRVNCWVQTYRDGIPVANFD